MAQISVHDSYPEDSHYDAVVSIETATPQINPYEFDLDSLAADELAWDLLAHVEPYDVTGMPAEQDTGELTLHAYTISGNSPYALLARAVEGAYRSKHEDKDAAQLAEENSTYEHRTDFILILDITHLDDIKPAAAVRVTNCLDGVSSAQAAASHNSVTPYSLKMTDIEKRRGLWDVSPVLTNDGYERGVAHSFAQNSVLKLAAEKGIPRLISTMSVSEAEQDIAVGIPQERMPVNAGNENQAYWSCNLSNVKGAIDLAKVPKAPAELRTPLDAHNKKWDRLNTLNRLQGGVLVREVGRQETDPYDHEVFKDHLLIDKKVAKGEVSVTVGLEQVIADQEAELVWEMYECGFRALNKSNLSRQSLTKEELFAELSDPSVVKYVARTEEGIVGLMAVEKGLYREQAEDWPLQDDELLDLFQAAYDPDAPSFYISTFVVNKSSDANHLVRVSRLVLQGALLHFQETCRALQARACCFFDCAPDNEFLMKYIMDCSKSSKDFEGAEVEIWPVYCAEWYKIPVADLFDENKVENLLRTMPENTFGNLCELEFSSALPLEVQQQNLDGEADEYCHISNLSAFMRLDVEQRKAFLEQYAELLDNKSYILADIKRLGSITEQLQIGERVGCQLFPVMMLKESFDYSIASES